MKSLITDKCARGFNWKGKGEKRAFEEMMLKQVISRI
ncbi:hypothetical protein NP493_2213g00006 [Ridgeia piscesae]|uniref:Uncharacterized protein n=1 Tax=Ridgeia piscesae TaxID=27915 RepID=A0AAD9JJL0_RIDPI|nr:hypothetical protein NP493_2213g00006 [Ridgeia piscesae]